MYKGKNCPPSVCSVDEESSFVDVYLHIFVVCRRPAKTALSTAVENYDEGRSKLLSYPVCARSCHFSPLRLCGKFAELAEFQVSMKSSKFLNSVLCFFFFLRFLDLVILASVVWLIILFCSTMHLFSSSYTV